MAVKWFCQCIESLLCANAVKFRMLGSGFDY